MKLFLTFILVMLASVLTRQDTVSIFSVFEVVEKKDVNQKIIYALGESEFILDKDENSPFIAFYLANAESDALKSMKDNSDQTVMLLPSKQAFGANNEYKGVVALQNKSELDISHIKKIKAGTNRVEVFLDYKGAKIWADYTEKVINKKVAFVVNDFVYDMPVMIGQIKTGALIIGGLSNDTEVELLKDTLDNK